MAKKRRRPRFEFPVDPPGKYWFLYWIGPIEYPNNGFVISYHFINTSEENDDTSNFIKQHSIVIKKPLHSLYFFTIGCIFDKDGKMTASPKDYSRKQTAEVKMNPNFRSTKQPLPPSSEILYPIPEDTEGFHFYKFLGGLKLDNRDTLIILPMHAVCNFFYFKSSALIEILTDNRLAEFVDYNNLKFYPREEGGIKGVVYYDNLKLTKYEIEHVAKLLFIKKGEGTKGLNFIGSHLGNSLRHEGNNLKTYLNTVIPASCELTVHGKPFYYKEKKYFLVYEINKTNINMRDHFVVDEIDTMRKYPNESTEDRHNLEPKLKKGTVGLGVDGDLEISIDSSPGNSFTPIVTQKTEENIFDIDIQINHPKRVDQENAYVSEIKTLPSDLEEVTLAGKEAYSESKSQRENYLKAQILDRLEYIEMLCNILWDEYDIRNQSIPLRHFVDITGYSTVYANGKRFEVMIKQLTYDGQYFYLIEGRNGLTGIIANIHLTPIDDVAMEQLAEAFAKDEMEWSRIYRRRTAYSKRYSVKIIQPIKHQYKDKKNKQEVATHAAQKIHKKIVASI